jgi:hypothetical protein
MGYWYILALKVPFEVNNSGTQQAMKDLFVSHGPVAFEQFLEIGT